MNGNAYRVQESRVVSETLDGETILINLDTGYYYSMNETASFAWDKLRAGHSADQIARLLEALYEAAPGAAQESVNALVALLAADHVIEEVGEAADAALPDALAAKAPFVPVEVKKYEDMRETLLADPIHDVNPAGWPSLKQ